MIRLSQGFIAVAILALAGLRAAPPAVMIGSAWYPELSPPAQIEADLSLMERSGLREVRVGEYAWDSLEPREGVYTLDWLQQVIDAAQRHGIYVVIGTPSDGMPNWLAKKYPEVLRIDVDGRRSRADAYRNFSYANRKYRELCRAIVTRLAQRFGHHPAVIGWQIGNEPTEDSYDPQAVADYRDWLRDKYGDLAGFNRRLTLAYWSHRVDNWDEVLPPPATGGPSPGLYLDYRRFVTAEWRHFHQAQAEVIRAYADSRQFVTTNLGGLAWADRFNRHEVTKDFDLVGWDNYVGRERPDPGHPSTYESLPAFDPWRNGASHDLVRSWKHRNFWVMEMQPAFVDWAPVSNAVPPGITRDMIWQAIGHGADGVSLWQWRAGLNAVGQYHGTLTGPDGQPVPVLTEVSQAAQEAARADAALAGTTPRASVAILYDYDSRWAIDLHRQTQRYDAVDVLLGYYRALHRDNRSVDIIDPSDDLSRYQVVAAPSLTVLSRALAERLRRYVEQGGCLVLGPRSGAMDENNALNVERQPGPLVPDLGGRVEQYYSLLGPVKVDGAWGAGEADVWAEQLSTQTAAAEVMLRYDAGTGWLDHQPAALRRRIGRGSLVYLGAVFDDAIMGRIFERLLATAPGEAFPVPAGVEVCRRVGTDHQVFIVINHGSQRAAVRLPAGLKNAWDGQALHGLALEPRDVAVLTQSLPPR